MNNTVAILFSGGTDSTLTASLEQVNYQNIHLLSYCRCGISSIDNTSKHARKLALKYSDKTFIHKIFDVDNIFKELSYENYLNNITKHRFFLLSNCGFCKLAMHVKTIQYCLKNNIQYVCDGSNKNMYIYPFQRIELISMLKDFYGEYKITYYNPVFDIPSEEDVSFHESRIKNLLKKPSSSPSKGPATVGSMLQKTGLVEKNNIKGSSYDKLHQANCMQLFLFRIFALGYFIPTFGMDRYVKRTIDIFKDKIDYSRKIINREQHS